MQDRFLTRYYDTKTEQIIKLNTIINTCENGIDIEFYGICVSGDGQISQVELDKNEQRFKRMQCSGLKDKNGKLIYEKDIVRDTSTQTVYKVSHKKCAFYLENKKYIGYFHELSQCFSISRLEVIGNVYENPELIGGVK